MTDDKIDARFDTMLREHGESWRAANNHRPAIDWDEVTASRRSWVGLAIVAVAFAAAAIIVPLAIVANNHATKHVTPSHTPPPPKVAQQGAPKYIVAIRDNETMFFRSGQLNNVYGQKPLHNRPLALAVSASSESAFAAYQLPGCRTMIDNTTISYPKHLSTLTANPVTTLPGGVPPAYADAGLPAPMAVSPDGTMLAMVLMAPGNPGTNACGSREELLILNLTDKTTIVLTTGDPVEWLHSLAWSPTSKQVAFQVARNCDVEPQNSNSCPIPSSLGTYVYDVGAPQRVIDRMSRVLPVAPSPQSESSYGPVLWWKGQLATFFGGKLLGLDGAGGTTGVLASGFPQDLLAVSSDSTGDHLLLSTTPLQVDNAIRNGTNHYRVTAELYRWDRGLLVHLTPPPANADLTAGPWIQPGW